MEQRVYCAISPRHLLALNWPSSSSGGSGNGVEQLEGQRRRAAAGMAAMSSVAVMITPKSSPSSGVGLFVFANFTWPVSSTLRPNVSGMSSYLTLQTPNYK